MLEPLRREARRDLLIESHKHRAVKLLRQIPSIGPIRSALLVALVQTPHRFRTKRQLWAYSGFALQTHDSGEYRYVRGKLRRNRERVTVLRAMARLTLARKIATIALTIWKKGVDFDAKELNQQAG